MNLSTSSLFSQLLSLVDRSRFARLVRDTGSERRSKGFASWDHFVACSSASSPRRAACARSTPA
jgi:hypothetical protein